MQSSERGKVSAIALLLGLFTLVIALLLGYEKLGFLAGSRCTISNPFLQRDEGYRACSPYAVMATLREAASANSTVVTLQRFTSYGQANDYLSSLTSSETLRCSVSKNPLNGKPSLLRPPDSIHSFVGVIFAFCMSAIFLFIGIGKRFAKRESIFNKLVGILLAIPCFLPPYAVYASINTLLQVRATESWPTVTGTVRASEYRCGADRVRGGSRYWADVLYDYSVDGKPFTSNQLSLRRTFSSFAEITRRVAEYPPGKAVTVRYDPVDPSQAVLDNEQKTLYVFIALAAIFVVGIEICIVISVLRNRRLR